MHNIIDLTFKFEFGLLNNRHMLVEISFDDHVKKVDPTNSEIILKNVKLPNLIFIRFTGKITGKDTIVDNNGNIINDMYIKILEIKMDRLKIPTWVIEKKLSYITEFGNKINSSYIGFNGEMVINIPESNGFAFYRRLCKDDN